jgi:hypothetical protein
MKETLTMEAKAGMSTKGIAEQIVLHGYGKTWTTDAELVSAIDAALISERERCRAIVQRARETGDTDLRSIIAWIRSGDHVDEKAE